MFSVNYFNLHFVLLHLRKLLYQFTVQKFLIFIQHH